MTANTDIPDVIHEKIQYVRFAFYAWRWIHYVLGMSAVTCSILVANYPANDANHWVPVPLTVLALIAAIFTGLLTFMGAESKSKLYFRAWRLLESAKGAYLLGDADERYLAAKQKEAEEIISSSDGTA